MATTSRPLRPHVPSDRRLVHWLPSETSTPVSAEDGSRVSQVLAFAWSTDTLRTYGAGLLAWHVWHDQRGSPEAERYFVAALAGSFSGSTIASYVYGIRAWHTIHRQPWNVDKITLDALLSAANALTPESSKCKPREPYTVEILEMIIAKLDLTNPLDAAVAACLTTTFYSAARLGEFTVPTLDGFDRHKHISRSGVGSKTDRDGNTTKTFQLPSTKVSVTAGEEVAWAAQTGPSDPQYLIDNHLRINDPQPDEALFAYLHKGLRRPLTKRAFLERVHRALRDAGQSPLPGHGIRIGSTLEYLLRGVPFDVMKVIGRWAGDSFILYLRKHGAILARYLQAKPELAQQVTALCMPPVR
ncbi:hypothetical protein CYLTODRAFT_433218 [Cylindrobasidium torrendii FP15055 ss-10]|uniref:DNA breaking-rejoining enzyme n=1 Tax=Cylindrobasidium torrendii FP15055 ss-10 TaxID=1314674 RepID=A0A0D7AWM6_9AGAR|nr:hypothetical protein CYLTODRAFT_433218 [Cylindrobasidium torrendii FP15055 ss-10]